MSKIIDLPPNAEEMIKSMRALGYSFSTALADVIDNSISAGASHIHIFTPPAPDDEQYVAILDDGSGMTYDVLIESMRHASKNPEKTRSKVDLGRFGLGMKTASLSQCREFSVVTKTAEGICAAGWSLDTVAKAGNWALTVFEEQEYKNFPCFELLSRLDTGTLLVWENFDVLASQTERVHEALTERLVDAKDHLSLVYHRIMNDAENPVEFSINYQVIKPKDPFLESRLGGPDAYPTEYLYVPGFPNDPVVVTGYTLPHQNKISNDQMQKLGLKGRSLTDDQGFYIYRGKRLIFWGKWLRMAGKAQATKLSRVCVDVPNCMDRIWSLDIKKSTAEPPKVIRDRLAEYLNILIAKSKNIQSGRGARVRKIKGDDSAVWTTSVTEGRRFSVRLNYQCPVLLELMEGLTDQQRKMLTAYLGLLEFFYPSRWVYAQYQEDKACAFNSSEDKEATEKLKEIYKALSSMKAGDDTEIEMLRSMLLSCATETDSVLLTQTILRSLK